MSYIPPNRRNVNRAAFTRPSGDPLSGINIDNIPDGARVFVDGTEIPTIGGRRVPFAARGNVLHVQTANGSAARSTDQTGYGGFGAGDNFDWNTMDPAVAYPTPGSPPAPTASESVYELRILNAPAGGGIVWFDGRPVAPLPLTPAWNGHRVEWPMGEVAVRIQLPDRSLRTAVARVPGNIDFNEMTVTPAPPIVIGTGIGGTAPTNGTLTINGPAGFIIALATRAAPASPLAPPAPLPASGTTGALSVPAGEYVVGAINYGGVAKTRNVTIRAGAATVEDVMTYFPRAQLTVSGTPGLQVAIAAVGSPVPLVPIATIPASGAISVPWQEGRYDLGVSNGTAAVKRTIIVPPAGLAVDVRDWLAAPASPPVAATPGNLTVTGGVGWVLTLTPAGASAFINRLPILADGRVAFPVPAGTYSLKVDDGAGHTAAREVIVPPAGASVDVTPWLASALAATQGTTSPVAGGGTVLLAGAPPMSRVRVAGLADYTVDDTGRPVAIHLPVGAHAITVIPPSGATRVASASVTAGASTDLAFGAMPTPAAVTPGDEPMPTIQTVDEMAGPVLNRQPWMPATLRPGAEIVGPDGVRYRALAAAGGVTMMPLKADGTPDTGWSTTAKVLAVGTVLAAGGLAWWYYRQPTKSADND